MIDAVKKWNGIKETSRQIQLQEVIKNDKKYRNDWSQSIDYFII